MNPSEVRDHWADRSGAYSPGYYAHYGPDETSEAVRERLASTISPDASVLELGCSAGRHLAHLAANGYGNVSGVDVNDDAFDVMAEAYPDLTTTGTFYADSIESVVGEFDDGQFDAVFSVETLQHLHPDSAWVFDELVRVTDDVLITAENEDAGDGELEDAGDTGPGDADARDTDPTDADIGHAADRANGDDPSEGGIGDDGTSETGDDGTSGAGSEGAGETADAGERGAGDAGLPAVTYVDGEVPLYVRDWNRVFTERGMVEVDRETVGRDTLRAFRPAVD